MTRENDDLQNVAQTLHFCATPQATGKRCITEITSEMRQEIEDLAILYPDLRANAIAARAVQESDPERTSELAYLLVFEFAAKIARAERAKQAQARHEQLCLPGFEHIPLRITVADKKRVRTQKATYSQVRDYVRRLSNRHMDRMRNDAKLREGRELLKRMARYNRTAPGIKVEEVLLRESET
jgi:hypothetical protein